MGVVQCFFCCCQWRRRRSGYRYRRMQSYRVNAVAGEEGSRGRRLFSSYLQTPTKFIGEIHVVLSTILIFTFVIVITIYSVLDEAENAEIENYRLGLITFLSVSLVGCFLDLGLALFLIHAAKQMSRTKCLFWWRSTFVSMILVIMLSACFAVLVGTSLILIATLPNAAFKPFALYVVGGFLGDISNSRAKIKGCQLQAFQLDNLDDWVDSGVAPGNKPMTSSLDGNQSPRGRSVVIYADSSENGNSGGNFESHGDTATTAAAVVEEILHEKFNFLSKPTSSLKTKPNK